MCPDLYCRHFGVIMSRARWLSKSASLARAMSLPSSITGETHQRFTEDKPLQFRPGLSAYNSNRGEEMIKIAFKNGESVKFDVTGWGAQDIADLSEYCSLSKGFQDAGVSHFMETAFDLPSALDPQFDPLKAIQSKQVIEAILGFGEGYDGVIYGSNKTAYLQWFAQMLSPKGDAAQGDYDIEASHKALRELGIRDEKGNLNLLALREAGSYTRGTYGTGAPNYHNLMNHLHQLV